MKTGNVTLDVVGSCFECPDEDRVRQLVGTVLSAEKQPWTSVGIVLADHATVTELNRNWLDHDWDTDVLSFLVDESEGGIEGEVYVDVETAQERCAEFQTTVTEEIERYIVHGLLHLAGYDDADDPGRARMRALEDTYLSA